MPRRAVLCYTGFGCVVFVWAAYSYLLCRVWCVRVRVSAGFCACLCVRDCVRIPCVYVHGSSFASYPKGKKYLQHQGQEITWDSVRRVLAMDDDLARQGLDRRVPRLTKKAVDLTNFSKMTVSFAMVIFSKEFIAALETLGDSRDSAALRYVKAVGQLFDILLSRQKVACFLIYTT